MVSGLCMLLRGRFIGVSEACHVATNYQELLETYMQICCPKIVHFFLVDVCVCVCDKKFSTLRCCLYKYISFHLSCSNSSCLWGLIPHALTILCGTAFLCVHTAQNTKTGPFQKDYWVTGSLFPVAACCCHCVGRRRMFCQQLASNFLSS